MSIGFAGGKAHNSIAYTVWNEKHTEQGNVEVGFSIGKIHTSTISYTNQQSNSIIALWRVSKSFYMHFQLQRDTR